MINRILLAVILCIPLVSVVQGQAEDSMVLREDFFSPLLNRTYEYNLYLPSGYEGSDAHYPVIYLLHGRGDNMDGWLEARGALDELIADGSIPPLIAVMPDMPSSERAGYYVDSQYTGTLYPAEPVESAFIGDLLPHIDATYRTVAEREGRLIGGNSMGGYGATRYAMRYPELFIGALILSPAVYLPLPPLESSTREFGAFGQGDQLFDEAVYQRLNYPNLSESLAESALPLYLFIAVGDDEWKNPLPEDALHDLDMEAHLLFNHVVRIPNVAAEFRVYNGGHDWIVWERGFREGIQYLTRYVQGE